MAPWLLIGGGFVGAVVVAVLVTLLVVGKINLGGVVTGIGDKVSSWGWGVKVKDADKASGYSAVFLANGQVYFGRVFSSWGQYLTLTDVFYLRIQRQLQPPQEEEGADGVKRETQLIKLGEELHGPVDEIKINRDQVLFMEKMKSDSRVVQGIKKFYEQKK